MFIAGEELYSTVVLYHFTEYRLFFISLFLLYSRYRTQSHESYSMINPKSGTRKVTWRRGWKAWATSIFSRLRPHGSSILDRVLHCHYRPFLPFMDLYLHLPGEDVDAITIRESSFPAKAWTKVWIQWSCLYFKFNVCIAWVWINFVQAFSKYIVTILSKILILLWFKLFYIRTGTK